MTKKEIIEKVIVPIENAGFKAFFVGGCVRDKLMGVEPHDFDICTDAAPKELHKIFNHFSEQKSEEFGVTMPIIDGELFEIATMRKDITKGRHPKIEFTRNIEEDALRRDFTVNALYEDKDGNIIDPTKKGVKDIKSKTLRFVGSARDRILEDPLRIFRYVRFISQKGFSYINSDRITIGNLVNETGSFHLFEDVSRERQLKELIGIFGGKYFSSKIITELMEPFGINDVIDLHCILEDMKECTQNPKWHSEGSVVNDFGEYIRYGTVFEHTLLVVDKMIEQEHDWLDILAAILHDVGKYTAGIEQGCKPGCEWPITKGHDIIGAPIAYDFCKKLGMSNSDSELIRWLVANHMNAHNISKTKSKCKIWKLLSSKEFDRLLKLSIADSNGSIHTAPNEYLDLCELIKLPEYAPLVKKEMPVPLVTGTDLIAEFDLVPNPNFKKALEVGYIMQIDQNSSKKEILSNIRNLAKEKH